MLPLLPPTDPYFDRLLSSPHLPSPPSPSPRRATYPLFTLCRPLLHSLVTTRSTPPSSPPSRPSTPSSSPFHATPHHSIPTADPPTTYLAYYAWRRPAFSYPIFDGRLCSSIPLTPSLSPLCLHGNRDTWIIAVPFHPRRARRHDMCISHLHVRH